MNDDSARAVPGDPAPPAAPDSEAWEWDLVSFWREAPDEQPAATPSNGGHSAPSFDDDAMPWLWGEQAARQPQPLPAAALPAPAAPSTDWGPIVRELVETILLTLLIFVLMRAAVQNYRIEGYSMEPNLHEGQRLFVNKLPYYVGEPDRGDIVVLEFPKGDPTGPERDYIKRVIGIPGDTVECQPGQIIVNGQPIAEPYIPNPNSYYCEPRTLGPNDYFVLGDNRNQSSDSHAWGTLERRYIIGKAWLIYWPMQDMGLVPNYPIEAATPAPSTVTSQE